MKIDEITQRLRHNPKRSIWVFVVKRPNNWFENIWSSQVAFWGNHLKPDEAGGHFQPRVIWGPEQEREGGEKGVRQEQALRKTLPAGLPTNLTPQQGKITQKEAEITWRPARTVTRMLKIGRLIQLIRILCAPKADFYLSCAIWFWLELYMKNPGHVVTRNPFMDFLCSISGFLSLTWVGIGNGIITNTNGDSCDFREKSYL